MITPEQKKKIMIMAGVFVAALLALVVILILPGMKKNAPPGNEAVVQQPTPSTNETQSTPAGPEGTTNVGNPPVSTPNANPPGAQGMPGMPPTKPGTTTAGVMSKPAPPLVPPTVLPSLAPPINLNSKYDPFSGGPRPPKPKVPKRYINWLTPQDQRIYNEIMDRSVKSNNANVNEGEIYIAYIPFVHNSSYKAMPYVPTARQEEDIETPPGRHAGYVYSEGGKVYAIFEDQTHTTKVVSVGDTLNGYTVKAISYNMMTLTDGIRDYHLKLQPIDSFQWGANAVVDAETEVPRNAPPRWGNK